MRLLDDLFIGLRFFSRLPVPATERERMLGTGGLAPVATIVPFAGAVIGAVPALVHLVVWWVGLPPPVDATLALTASVVVTGALHEDALADCADGFGGGRTREGKLEIMRDSRIGAFGACAIGLSLLLRVTALATIVAQAPLAAAGIVVGAAAMSRGACLLPLAVLPPARAAGAGASAVVSASRAAVAAGGAALILVAVGLAIGRPLAAVVAVIMALAGAAMVSRLARDQIGGQTGDVAGAAQQIAELSVLLVFAAGPATI